jgi:2-iminobutanoate/2-iminopropanoate deaminase
MKTKIETTNAPKAVGPYSQAIADSNFVFASGQIPLNAAGKMLDGPIEEQVSQIMKNLGTVLESSGCLLKDVVKATIYLTDMADYAKVNDAYGSYFSEPFPAREAVCVKALPLGARVEISVIAIRH